MTKQEFCKTIDHAILWQNNSREVVEKRCREVVKYGFACICCNPCEVAFARSIIGDAAGVCAVVGYPMGANTTVSYTHLDVYKRQRVSQPNCETDGSSSNESWS